MTTGKRDVGGGHGQSLRETLCAEFAISVFKLCLYCVHKNKIMCVSLQDAAYALLLVQFNLND